MSNVYSRKVEYLHPLVYKTLEELLHTVPQQQNQRGHPVLSAISSISEDVNTFHNYNPNLEFLLFDDVIPVSDKINLQEKGSINNSNNTTMNSSSVGTSRWSLGGITAHMGDNTTAGSFSSDSDSQQQLALFVSNRFKIRSKCNITITGWTMWYRGRWSSPYAWNSIVVTGQGITSK